LDIMLSHGLARSSVYNSAWGTVNAVNKTKSMSFNEEKHHFHLIKNRKILQRALNL
jgi:hypothetical protein